ncbi:MAG TPA: hypothetical protein VFU76_05595 [Terriglobales bacterium]|nr:hypothetical protein [Terriglobales bacterium]
MKSRIALLALLLLTAFAYLERPGAQAAAPPAAVQGPTDLAGRPGVFRFITDEQIRAQRIEISELRTSLDRVHATLDRLTRDPETQRRMQAEFDLWMSHLGREEQRLDVSVSPTAAVAERRLTDMKGSRSCGTCHAGGPITRSDE